MSITRPVWQLSVASSLAHYAVAKLCILSSSEITDQQHSALWWTTGRKCQTHYCSEYDAAVQQSVPDIIIASFVTAEKQKAYIGCWSIAVKEMIACV